ncbi:hypothetical protein [Pendulispora albinea]|uniref:Uncharacterized protein n=1 Tax=Pendulispora albinea TaxID=2741071 RepID=A0ABZ2MBW8_9BACT
MKSIRSTLPPRLVAASFGLASAGMGAAACNMLLDNGEARFEGGDAGGRDGGGQGSYCRQQQPAPALCYDFDDSRPLDAGFTFRAADRSVVQIDSKNSISAPMALLVELPEGLSEEATAYLARTIEGPLPTETRVSFDILLEAASPAGDVEKPVAKVLDILARSPATGPRRSLGVTIGPELAAIQERIPGGNDGSVAEYPSIAFPDGAVKPGTWSHIELHLQWRQQTYRAFVGHVKVIDSPMAAAWPSTDTGVELRLGISYRPKKKTNFTWRFRYDNVVWNVTP